MLLVQFAPILLFLTIYGGGVQAVARRWHEQRGSLCSVCHRGRFLAPARETACEVSASARHVDSAPQAMCTVLPVRGKPTRSHHSLSVVYATQHPSTLSGVWMRAGVPITCPEIPCTLRSQTSSPERRDSIKTTGCGQLLRVVKCTVLGRIHVLRVPDNRGI